jgi:hypothetical protein
MVTPGSGEKPFRIQVGCTCIGCEVAEPLGRRVHPQCSPAFDQPVNGRISHATPPFASRGPKQPPRHAVQEQPVYLLVQANNVVNHGLGLVRVQGLRYARVLRITGKELCNVVGGHCLYLV